MRCGQDVVAGNDRPASAVLALPGILRDCSLDLDLRRVDLGRWLFTGQAGSRWYGDGSAAFGKEIRGADRWAGFGDGLVNKVPLGI